MIAWLRVVFTSSEILVMFLLVYGGVESLALSTELQFGFRLPDPRPSLAILRLAAIAYAIHRVLWFHPILRADYRQWLATTPWTRHKPLPLGPVHLVAQDVVLLAGIFLLTWPVHGVHLVSVFQCFLIFYLLALGCSLLLTGNRLFTYAVGFGAGLMAHLVTAPALGLAAGIASYGIGYVGFRHSLKRFPWDGDVLGSRPLPTAFAAEMPASTQEVGWPFQRLGPKFPDQARVPLADAILGSLLLGWWAHGLSSLVEADSQLVAPVFFLICAAGFMPLFRLSRYCNGYLPPISLWGRLITGRWLIPGYDQVFVAPLLALFVGCAALGLESVPGFDPAITFSLAGSAACMIVLGMGPDRMTWRLTGNHRVVIGGVKYPVERVG